MNSKKVGGNMAQKRISMRKIREVLRLHFEARISQAKIAGVVRISRYTVHQYIMRFTAADLSWPLYLRDDELERKLFSDNIGKSNRPEPDYLYLLQEIKKPDATLAVLWKEHKEQHPNGYQYSYFCDLFNAYCKKMDFLKSILTSGK
jgi:transposase